MNQTPNRLPTHRSDASDQPRSNRTARASYAGDVPHIAQGSVSHGQASRPAQGSASHGQASRPAQGSASHGQASRSAQGFASHGQTSRPTQGSERAGRSADENFRTAMLQRAQAKAAAKAAARRTRNGRIALFCVAFVVLGLASWGIFNLFLHIHSGKPFLVAPLASGTSSTLEAPLSTLDTAGLVLSDPVANPGTQYDYVTDVSAYEKYMDPAESAEYLILVNAENVLGSGDIPADLTDVADTRGDRAAQQMRLAAEKALEAFLREMRACGFSDVTVTSAYRSYNTQDYLFNSYVSKEMLAHSDWTRAQAEAYVVTYSCRPGTSEHQTGLCADMHNLASADVSFADQSVAKWLAQNCWRFGFVLRFPEDKVSVTGVSFEPWHFRFVGRTAAAEMNTLNMCLEEYTAYLASK